MGEEKHDCGIFATIEADVKFLVSGVNVQIRVGGQDVLDD